jgi:hypothetical protein
MFEWKLWRRDPTDGLRVVVNVRSIMSPLGAISSVVSIVVRVDGDAFELELLLNTLGILGSDMRGLPLERVGVVGGMPKREWKITLSRE